MIKYAKVTNQETGLCDVGLGTNVQFYQSIGMQKLDVQQSDIDGNWYLSELCPMKTDEQKAQEEKERIAKLYLTGADVERGIYQAKGMDFDDILAFVTANPPEGLDIKALRIELKANNFYRGNPYVDVIGRKLGFTKEQLDKFFEKKDYHYLTNCTLTVNAVPEESTVIINDVEQKQITVPYGSQISIQVSAEGYKTYSDVINELLEDETLDVVMSIEDITDNNDDK